MHTRVRGTGRNSYPGSRASIGNRNPRPPGCTFDCTQNPYTEKRREYPGTVEREADHSTVLNRVPLALDGTLDALLVRLNGYFSLRGVLF
eukprot:2525874-Rhodomonas_salina.1